MKVPTNVSANITNRNVARFKAAWDDMLRVMFAWILHICGSSWVAVPICGFSESSSRKLHCARSIVDTPLAIISFMPKPRAAMAIASNNMTWVIILL